MPSAGQKGLFFTSLSCTFVRFGRNLSTGKDKTMRKIETKKLAAAVTALALCSGVLTGCGGAPLRLPLPAKQAARRLTKWQQRMWQT